MRAFATVLALNLITLTACSSAPADAAPGAASQPASRDAFAELPNVPPGAEEAIFAGGCFWCMESSFEEIDGVLAVTSGYIGGHVKRPTYMQVSSRSSGHAEAIHVVFDPKKISYDKLLWHFWRNVDPTTSERQFCDAGDEYRPEIFVLSDAQGKLAEASKQQVIKTKTFTGDVMVKISKASRFWPAEVYHQDFYKKNPVRYWSYRRGCGRDARLRELWGPQAGHHD
jgi:peptide-methionine (S)-S-oxide reductase